MSYAHATNLTSCVRCGRPAAVSEDGWVLCAKHGLEHAKAKAAQRDQAPFLGAECERKDQ